MIGPAERSWWAARVVLLLFNLCVGVRMHWSYWAVYYAIATQLCFSGVVGVSRRLPRPSTDGTLIVKLDYLMLTMCGFGVVFSVLLSAILVARTM